MRRSQHARAVCGRGGPAYWGGAGSPRHHRRSISCPIDSSGGHTTVLWRMSMRCAMVWFVVNRKSGRAGDEDEAFVTALLTASRVLVGVSARSLSEVESTVTVPQFRTLGGLERYGKLNLT